MTWFKQTEQKFPASPDSQPPAAPLAAPAVPAPSSGAQIDQRLTPPTPAIAAAPAVPASSRVSRGLVLRGEITGREDLSIDGEVEGTLRLDGARVTVGPAGRVRASVTAREIVIHGEVRGELRAEERIEIGRSGSVHGNAAAKRIAIEDGAIFNGAIEVLRPAEAAGNTRADVRTAARAAASASASGPASGPKDSSAPAPEPKAETALRNERVVASDSIN